MIVKRIRKGARQARGTITRVVASVQALSRYVVDADPWAMAEFDRVRSLTDYALHVQQRAIEPGEKVEAAGTFNLLGDDLCMWQMEMAAIASRSPRSRDPVEHFVYSWREDESPTAEQVEAAGAILLDVVGYGACPAIWSFHVNTSKDHGHLAVVRIDPATGLVAGDGWDIDRAHQAIAIIEERQGWASESNALYFASGGEVYDRVTGDKVRDSQGRQVGRRGAKPLPPKLAAKAVDIRQAVIGATDWTDIHARMATIAVAYRRKGSGAVVCVGDEEAKASLIHAGCSLTQLEDRLGPFEPDPSHAAQRYEAYKEAYRQRIAHIRSVHAQERARLKAWLDEMLSSLGAGTDPSLVAAVRAEYASTLQALDSAFGASKAAFAAARLSPHQWEAGGGPAIPAGFSLPTLLMPGNCAVEQPVSAPANFHPRHVAWRTDYHDESGTKVFTDLRSAIVVHNASPDSFDAALKLAAARWGTVRVRASRSNTLLAAERAAALGIVLVDANGRRLLPPPVRPANLARPPSASPRVKAPSVAASTALPPRRGQVSARSDPEQSSMPKPAPVAAPDEDISFEVRLAYAQGRLGSGLGLN